MSLRAAEVPPEMQKVFGKAQEIVSRYFEETTAKPEEGRIEVGGG